MKRSLVFDGPKGARRFDLCYEALLGGGDKKGDRARATLRKEARLLDAFESISKPDESKLASCAACQRAANPDARLIGATAAPIVISQEDYELLRQYVDTAPWLPRVARDAVDVQDWLATAPTLED